MKWEKIRYFKPHEFACKCGCGAGPEEMSEQLIMALDMARKDAGVTFRINSGFRCKRHNARVGGVNDSAHTKGLAVDISTPTGAGRIAIVEGLLGYFDRIGIYPTFVHVDLDPDKPRPVMWYGR